MLKIFSSAGLLALLGACSYVNAYEQAVYDLEPSYCYKSLAGIECYQEPFHRDERRLVNYFGPHPDRFDKPEPADQAPLSPPEMVNYWVKDAEPIPRPAPSGNVANLPWLDPELRRQEADKREFRRLAAKTEGTHALLKKMGIGPDGEVTLRRSRETKQATAKAGAPIKLEPPVIEVEVN